MEEVLKKSGRREVDILILAIPVNLIHLLDIDSVAGRPGQLEAIQRLLQVYRAVGQLIREGKVTHGQNRVWYISAGNQLKC